MSPSVLNEAPDLILFPVSKTDIFFGLSDFGSNQLVDTVYRYSGMHRDNGLLIMYGHDVQPGTYIQNAAVEDIAPTIFYKLGVPIPGDMDGKVLEAVFGDNYDPGRLRVSDNVCLQPVPNTDRIYTDQDESEIMARLEDMGYLG